MTQDINDMIASFRGGARPNKFRVTIYYPAVAGSPNHRDEFNITGATLPGSTTTPVMVPYKGRQIPVPGDRTFEDWTVNILNDVTFSHRDVFTRWLNAINGHRNNLQATSNYKDLTATLEVQQIDRDDAVLKTIRIYNAFPTHMGQIDLDYNQNDALEFFPVTFSLSHWEDITSNTTT